MWLVGTKQTKEHIRKRVKSRKKSAQKRFWSKIKKTKTCWEWIGSKNTDNYGIVGVNKKNIKVHRFSWELHFGKIPKGMCVLHKCDNPPCVRPDHLFLGTPKDNTQDMIKKGRNGNATGCKNGNVRLTEKQVLKIRKLYSMGKYLQKELGKIFGVRQVTISAIITNRSWKHLINKKYGGSKSED